MEMPGNDQLRFCHWKIWTMKGCRLAAFALCWRSADAPASHDRVSRRSFSRASNADLPAASSGLMPATPAHLASGRCARHGTSL
jgi:hypothetical protein